MRIEVGDRLLVLANGGSFVIPLAALETPQCS